MDRKELTRQYKDTPRPMGVYRVHNTVDGKSLLGVSVDAPARLNRHRAQLKMGVHQDKALQADWNRLGADAFELEVLDTLPPAEDPTHDPADDLRVLLDLWVDKLHAGEAPGYGTSLR